jgi:hypothetical protein
MSAENMVEIQQVLDHLFNEKHIPFKLVAQKLTDEGLGECRVHFYDARLHSVVFGLEGDMSIGDQVRQAVLWKLGLAKPSAEHLLRSAAM